MHTCIHTYIHTYTYVHYISRCCDAEENVCKQPNKLNEQSAATEYMRAVVVAGGEGDGGGVTE